VNLLTIGQVAKNSNLSCDAIRLYERYGLIQPPIRAANGYRQYPKQIVEQLKFIIRVKKMGFTLKEIQELLSIHQSSEHSCIEIKQHSLIKLEQISSKIEELQTLKYGLERLVYDCENNSNNVCPIFMLLDNGTKK